MEIQTARLPLPAVKESGSAKVKQLFCSFFQNNRLDPSKAARKILNCQVPSVTHPDPQHSGEKTNIWGDLHPMTLSGVILPGLVHFWRVMGSFGAGFVIIVGECNQPNSPSLPMYIHKARGKESCNVLDPMNNTLAKMSRRNPACFIPSIW